MVGVILFSYLLSHGYQLMIFETWRWCICCQLTGIQDDILMLRISDFSFSVFTYFQNSPNQFVMSQASSLLVNPLIGIRNSTHEILKPGPSSQGKFPILRVLSQQRTEAHNTKMHQPILFQLERHDHVLTNQFFSYRREPINRW